jgi:hypothetical protein
LSFLYRNDRQHAFAGEVITCARPRRKFSRDFGILTGCDEPSLVGDVPEVFVMVKEKQNADQGARGFRRRCCADENERVSAIGPESDAGFDSRCRDWPARSWIILFSEFGYREKRGKAALVECRMKFFGSGDEGFG